MFEKFENFDVEVRDLLDVRKGCSRTFEKILGEVHLDRGSCGPPGPKGQPRPGGVITTQTNLTALDRGNTN